MTIPVLKAYYQIDPDEDVEKAFSKIEGLRQAFCGGPLLPRTDDQWVYGGPWLEEVRHGTVSAPPGLIAALDKLPEALRIGDPAWEAIESLSLIAVFGVDSSTGEYREVDINAAGFAYLALLDILPVRQVEWLALAAVFYEDLSRATCGEPEEWVKPVLNLKLGPGGRGVRLSLVRLMEQLAWVVCRINTPQAYQLLLRFLRHPWPEVRETGARFLRSWEGPGLFEAIRKAALLGVQDPDARRANGFLIQKLVKCGAEEALPILESLRGTELDGMALDDAFRSLSKLPRVSKQPAAVRPKPIFEPDERVLMGVLQSSGNRVGIAVEPARKVPLGNFRSSGATATRASVRRSQHPAHVGHVNVVLSGRGESIDNAEQLAVELAAAIWGVELTGTSISAANSPDTMYYTNDLEGDKPIHEGRTEPFLLVQGSSVSLWLVKQRDHRPYHQGLGVELALREGELTIGALRVYARWPDDPEGLLQSTVRGARQVWREWLELDPPPPMVIPGTVEGGENQPGLIT